MKNIAIVLLSLTLWSCQQKPADMTQHLSGYWEIDKVVFADGQQKEFAINTWIDYIEIVDSQGYRTKVQPTLEGTYISNDVVEKIEIKIENDSLHLYCSTEFDRWKETVISADDEQLVIVTADNKKFYYKKYKPLNLDFP